MLAAFENYVCELEGIANSVTERMGIDFSKHLDGEAGRQLRSVVRIDDLRRIGAFFTGETLAAKLITHVPSSVSSYADPACGCGDLLLAASARLPVDPSLESTLRLWNECLVGRDLVPSFIRAARARLTLAAINRGALPTEAHPKPSALLTSIKVGDGLKLRPCPGSALLINPPYGRVPAPVDCEWTQGQTTEAAVFLDALLGTCEPGVHLAAVLPEVLRAGSRYAQFRSAVTKRLNVVAAEPAGVFDALTDVDVFLMAGTTHAEPAERTTFHWTPRVTSKQLKDLAEIRVGPLVANREPNRGPWRLYVDARDVGGKSEIRPKRHRRFRGTVVAPPFVVVGRTNRPNEGEGPRLRATIVTADRPIALENHLISLAPNVHTVSACRDIVDIVESERTTEFLNDRLRCRHLTVTALREIPR
jgi:hypothetical protein